MEAFVKVAKRVGSVITERVWTFEGGIGEEGGHYKGSWACVEIGLMKGWAEEVDKTLKER